MYKVLPGIAVSSVCLYYMSLVCAVFLALSLRFTGRQLIKNSRHDNLSL